MESVTSQIETINNTFEYLIISWNVDGLRIEIWNYLKNYLVEKKPHILCLNETKKSESDLRDMFSTLKDYNFLINSYNPSRWHGVAILIRKDVKFESILKPINCKPRKGTLGNDAASGRVISILIDNKFNLVATYNPNSGVSKSEPLKNLSYRVEEWDPAIFSYLNDLSNKEPTIWIGDLNVCSESIDVSHPWFMHKWAGFTSEERDSFNGFMKDGKWIDIWRFQHPDEKAYSYRGRSKTFKHGMRLDSTIVSKELKDKVLSSFIETDCKADTDHVPIGIKLCM